MNAVEFQTVSKSYAIYDSPGDRLRELLSPRRVKRHTDFWALRDVSFEVKRGETFCIVGENGSGKSTLLQIVAGILQPTAGNVAVHGRVSALLELGAGFNPEFSGRDNVYLNGSILGLTTRQIDTFNVNNGTQNTALIPLSLPIQFPDLKLTVVKTTVCAPCAALSSFTGQNFGNDLDKWAKWIRMQK